MNGEWLIAISIGLASITYFIDSCFWMFRDLYDLAREKDEDSDDEKELPEYVKNMFS